MKNEELAYGSNSIKLKNNKNQRRKNHAKPKLKPNPKYHRSHNDRRRSK